MKVTAKLKNYRVSPQKARLVTNLVRGLDVDQALVQLMSSPKKASLPLKKLVESARSNAENNFGLVADNLFIEDVQVGEGITYKRWMPRAYGRATGIMKRTSNIVVVLNERVEGAGRKSASELKKERKARMERKDAESAEERKDVGKHGDHQHGRIETRDARAKGQTSGGGQKMFRRKSV